MASLEELNQEYSKLCGEAGHIMHIIEMWKKRLEKALSEIALVDEKAGRLPKPVASDAQPAIEAN